MKLHYSDNLFWLDATLDNHELARRAGFTFDNKEKKWFTPFSTVANKLAKYVDLETGKAIQAHRLTEVRNELASRAAESELEVPHNDSLWFRPFQKAGIEYMLKRPNTLLADQMGLGKTIMVIGLCNYLFTDKEKILIICPATLKLNWLREWNRWCTVSPLSVDIAYGNYYPKSDVVIINYDILSRHSKLIHNNLWDLVVLDEAHYLKNHKANRTKQVVGYRTLRPIAGKRKLALTGTPIVNRPVELFNVIKYLAPYGWQDKMKFARRYCNAFKGPWGWDMTGASHLEEFQQKLRSTIMIRRTKKDVLPQLPPKVHQVIEVQPNAKTAKLLKHEMSLADAPIHREQMMQWAQGNLKKASFGEIATIRREVAEAKIPFVIKYLEDAIESSGKVVVFTHHKNVVAALRSHFKDVCVVLDGSTSSVIDADKMSDRQRAVDNFQNKQEIKLFIGNIQAAGTGINLTAASHVVFAEISWVPGELEQCEDRVHRIGTTESVLIQFLVMASSIDAAIALTYTSKQGIIEKAIDERLSDEEELSRLLK